VVAPKVAKSREIPTKFDLTAVQGHPKSSILVSIESPCTRVTLAVSATVFERLTLKAVKSLKFPTLALFEAPTRRDPLEFGDEIWRQKTRMLGLPDGAEIMTLASFVFDTIPARDGQTDGWTDTLRSLLPALA